MTLQRYEVWQSITGTLGMLLWSFDLSLFAALHRPLLSVAAGMVFAAVVGSLFEWLMHKYLYHNAWPYDSALASFHEEHHRTFTGYHHIIVDDAHLNEIRPRQSWGKYDLSMPIVRFAQAALHVATTTLGIILPAWLLTHSIWFMLGTAAFGFSASWFVLYLHETMHRRPRRAICHLRWYKFLAARHVKHHHDFATNINLLLPIADLVMGTDT